MPGQEVVFGFGAHSSLDEVPELLRHAQQADRDGLDIFSLSDHPYIGGRLDAYAAIGFVLGGTQRLAGFANVTNLPLRPAPMLARTVASLSALSGGRVVLGAGAGGLWDRISGMGVPRLSPGDAVDSFEEAITLVKMLCGGGPPVTYQGSHYQVSQIDPAPVAAPQVWTGSVGRKSLAATGRVADGWIPGHAADWLSQRYRDSRPVIDEAAAAAGRDPREVRTIFNFPGQITSQPLAATRERDGRWIGGSPGQWAEELAGAVLEHDAAGFMLFSPQGGTPDTVSLTRWAREIVPAVREMTAKGRPDPALQSACLSVISLTVCLPLGDLAAPGCCVTAFLCLPSCEQKAEQSGTDVTEVLPKAERPAAGRPDANGHGFRPDVQGLRALAVSMVLIYHLYPSLVPGGYAGVDVFFVISGFLITGHLWRGYQRDGRVRLLDFWGRRARRLVPAAALVLAVTWLVSRFMLPSSELADTAGQIRASALYYQNWQLAHEAVNYLTADNAATPVQHFWSLSVEEQFYLVWPLLFVVAALVGRRRRRVVCAAGVVTLTAVSLAYSVYETRVDPAAAYFVTTTRMWELGAGGLLAMLPEGVHRVLGRQGWLGWAGLAAVLASAFALRGTSAFPGALALLPVGGAVMLIAGGSDQARYGAARLMSARPMVFLGGISYSLYLWHWPMISLLTTYTGKSPGVLSGLGLIAASVAAAWWTKTNVEDPVRFWSKLTGHGWRSLSTALAAVLPVTLASVYLASLPGQWDGRLGPGYPGAAALAGKAVSVPAKPVLPPPADAQAALPEYWQQGCLAAEEAAAPKVCVYGDKAHPTLTVALVGDSIAGNWFPALDTLALRYHWKLVTDLHATCPWTATWMNDPNTSVPGVRYTSCHQWNVTVQHDLLTSIRPNVVITSDFAELGSVAHPKVGPAAYADIAAGMAQYWKQLQGHGISVIPIMETPMMNFQPQDCVSVYGADPSACAIPPAEAIPQDSPIVQAAGLMGGSVKVIDMNQYICGRDICRSVVGNVLVYFDPHHLTSSYVTTMTPYFAARLFSTSAVLARTR